MNPSHKAHLLSIAPMVDWTNTHFRQLMRLIAPRALVYTEMQTLGAIFHNPQRALEYRDEEHPIALQVGGSEPSELARAAEMAEKAQFDEINLNVGCPSTKVQAGRFGACLMREKEHVSACIRAMKSATCIPVTAKTRIGIDHSDSYEFFFDFASELIEAGIDKLIVHARKAWLTGLNPKQNRTVPPLHYDYVHRLKAAYPELSVILNGNVNTLSLIQSQMQHIDGVMIGRLACDHPFGLSQIHAYFYPNVSLLSWEDVINTYAAYASEQTRQGVALSVLCKPLMNMAHGLPYSKTWKLSLMQFVQSKSPDGLQEVIQTYAGMMREKS